MEKVREAKSLESLDELNLAARTKSYLLKTFGCIDRIIYEGRILAYTYAKNPDATGKACKSFLELTDVLDKAGFIRHDITSGSFCVNLLYRAVYQDRNITPCYMDDLGVKGVEDTDHGTTYHYDFSFGNESYENYENPSPEQLDTIETTLRLNFRDEICDILMYRFGFEDGEVHNYKQTANKFRLSSRRVDEIVRTYTRKLRVWNVLPPILKSCDRQKEEISMLVEEIEKLHKDPIFKREEELKEKLRYISRIPFDCAITASNYLSGGTLNYTRIEDLNLSIRTYNCLKRAKINTVADIVKLPVEDWHKVRNLGIRSLKEVEDKIHSLGYESFRAFS